MLIVRSDDHPFVLAIDQHSVYAKSAENLSVQFVGEAGSAKLQDNCESYRRAPSRLATMVWFSAIPAIIAGVSLLV